MNNKNDPKVVRLVDANLNRLKEGIRVIEDIARYHDDNGPLALKLKNLRHQCRIDEKYLELLSSRDSINDVLRPSTKSEMSRANIEDILIANYKRAQESARVLEESTKIWGGELAERFKNIRYELYALEKENLLN
ncbi:MAG: thiamine-phosphate pyrophosphorylase [Campylobacterales bacterium]|nr:thiamine-phosphate pyrophosphorylase [Campylobacterales bacterium]